MNPRKTFLPLKAWITTITFLLLTVFTLPVFAADIYVATTGNDNTGNGNANNPYRTIKKAADAATPGTTVLVRGGTYLEADIRPRVSGTEDAMIVFRPASSSDEVIIKHPETFSNPGITTQVREQWLQDIRRIESSWDVNRLNHYTDSDIRYSIEGYVNNRLTDVFNLTQRNYIQIEGFTFRDYKYARNTININNAHGNAVINNRFINIGTVHAARWFWTGNGAERGDVTINVNGNNNVVRNNYFQSVIGETTSYAGNSSGNIITENTFIGAIGKNGNHSGSESSTLGGRFAGNLHNAFAFNYSGGSVNGGTIWLDVDVKDFIAIRNVAHNTAYFIFNESGCERNWIYENIVYNKPRGANNRMPADPNFFTDFSAQHIETGLFTAFWDTGSTWDARWINNVTYNLKQGINIERSWRDEVRNNIGYEDANTQHTGETLGLRIFETSINGFHSWHGLDLKGGGPQIIKNNLWYSTKKGNNGNFVRYMHPVQSATTVANFNAMINSTTELGVDPMFENPAAYDFRLKTGSPAKGSGYNGVDRGAYAVYPKTDVGYNKNLPLLEDVNVSFSKLNTSVKPGNTVSLEIKLNKPATKIMSFKIEPVAGDARLDADFRFVDNQTVTFAVGERTKTVRVEVLANPQDEIDQLLALRIVPAGATKIEEVGPRNLHLMKIIRVTKYAVTLNDIGDSMGQSIVQYYKQGETVTIDAKTRPGYTFAGWENGYHNIKLPLANINSARTTFTMPEYNPTLRAKWTLNGTKVNVTGVTMSPTTLSLAAGSSSNLTGTVNPTNATDKAVIWTSTNPLVATVSPTGVVTAVSAGTATITVTALDSKDNNNNYKKATCTVTVTGTSVPPVTGATMRTDGFYTIKNVNSGRYLDVEGNTVASGSNVVQGGTAHNFAAKTMWKLTASTTNGYYFMRSVANENLVIDVAEASTANGANIGLWTYGGGNNQQFKFVQVSTNTYTIRSRITNDGSGLDVEGNSLLANGNVLQWTIGTGTNQQWIVEFHDSTPDISLTPATATFPAATTGYTTRPAAQTFTVTNTSTIPTVATGAMTVALSGANAGSFTLSATSLASITAQNGTSTFTVQPNLGFAAGTYTATVTVSGTGLTSKTATVTFVVTPAPVTPATMRTDGFYTIKNVNSNRYLEVAGDVIGSGSNVVQGVISHDFSPNTMWKLKEASAGYYFMHTVANENYALDVFGAVPDDGANINLWTHNGGNNQQFKFVQVSEGVYTIHTWISNDASCVEVEGASMAAGGNVIQWPINGLPHQNWILEFHDPEITQLQLCSASTIFVYPNPTTGELKIKNEKLRMGDIENIEIFDADGRLVGAYPCDRPDTTINISHLIEGIYFLKINGETIKVIKK